MSTIQEANPIAIASIMLSLLSVASKSFFFSVACALNWKQLLCNWLSSVTDFFGIFVVVSWCFYSPQQNDENVAHLFSAIQTIWLYKLYICVFPLIVITSTGLHLTFTFDCYKNTAVRGDSIPRKMCIAIGVFGVVTIMWIAGVLCLILIFEITNFTWLAGILFLCGTTRLPETKNGSEFWFTLLSWITSGRSSFVPDYKGLTSYSKQQDVIMRICSINHVIYGSKNSLWTMATDDVALKYLDKECQESQYANVTFRKLRCHTNNTKQSKFIPMFIKEYYGFFFFEQLELYNSHKLQYERTNSDYEREQMLEHLFGIIIFGLITWFLGPLYAISRMLTLIFPVFIVVYLYCNDVFIWSVFMIDNGDMVKIDAFQVVMITIYLFLLLILMVMYAVNIREQFLLFHILGSKDFLNFSSVRPKVAKESIKKIQNHYYGVVTVPIRRAIVLDVFGEDLGPIIISYLPVQDHYDGIEEIVLKKTL